MGRGGHGSSGGSGGGRGSRRRVDGGKKVLGKIERGNRRRVKKIEGQSHKDVKPSSDNSAVTRQ